MGFLDLQTHLVYYVGMTKKFNVKKEPCMYNEEGIHCINSSYGGGRGMCMTHYVGCRYHVKKGNKTWEDFEKEGICKKKMTQEQKNNNQSHPHNSYKKNSEEQVPTISPNLDF